MIENHPSICWLLPFEPGCAQDLINSSLASVRLRAATILHALDGSNVSIGYTSIPSPDSHLLVVGKVGADCVSSRRDVLWLSAIHDYVSSGRPVVIDYTDNHLFLQGAMNRFYARIPRSQWVHWVVPSPWMRNDLLQRGFQNICLINDAFEVPITAPRFRTSIRRNGLQGLWFGHPSNVVYLAKSISEQVSSESEPFQLHLVSGGFNPNPLVDQLKKQPFISEVNLHSWSIEALVNVAKEVDFCFLPGNPFDPRKAGVGINRLTTALALGLPVLASPYSSYSQLKEYYSEIPVFGSIKISSDLIVALASRLGCFQSSLLSDYSPPSIGRTWIALFRSLAVTATT